MSHENIKAVGVGLAAGAFSFAIARKALNLRLLPSVALGLGTGAGVGVLVRRRFAGEAASRATVGVRMSGTLQATAAWRERIERRRFARLDPPEELPDEFLGRIDAYLYHIFPRLDRESLLRMRGVCRTTRQWADQTVLDIVSSTAADRLAVSFKEHAPSCRRIELLAEMGPELGRGEIGQILVSLRLLRNLRELCLDGIPIADAYTEALGSLSLKALSLKRSQISDTGLDTLTRRLDLEELDLSQCEGITDVGIGYLPRCQRLREADLWGCSGITDASLQSLTRCPQLEELDISQCPITVTGFGHLVQFPTLKRLYVENVERVGDREVREICRVNRLTHLSLGGCNIQDQDLRHVASVASSLISIKLWDCIQLTDEGMQYLAVCGELKIVHLARSDKLTDQGIGALTPLSGLEELDLTKLWRLTDQVFVSVEQFRELRRLFLYDCWKITDGAVDQLKSRLPRLTIYR